jgi:predicted RNase H-like HicB family nuclease
VIATGKNIEECREDLIEVIEEWVTIRLQRGLDIPTLDGRTIGVSQEPMAVV